MEERGALLGTVAGGILGNQVGGGQGKVLATGAGMVAGAFAGAAIGSRMDAFDRAQMNKAYASSLESGRSGEVSSWKNPDTGNSGSVEPLRTYQNSTGQYCREFQQTITVGGTTEQAYGTACRQPDGTWQIIGG
jgi:surface antigen